MTIITDNKAVIFSSWAFFKFEWTLSINGKNKDSNL